MAKILEQFTEAVMEELASLLKCAGDNTLVNFEIQRRLENVPGNLMDLFFMTRDMNEINNWHILKPYDRLGWVKTMLRYRIPGAVIDYSGDGRMVLRHNRVNYFLDVVVPKPTKRVRSYWKGMDDLCLLIGVCFYIAVITVSGGEPRDLFTEPEAICA